MVAAIRLEQVAAFAGIRNQVMPRFAVEKAASNHPAGRIAFPDFGKTQCGFSGSQGIPRTSVETRARACLPVNRLRNATAASVRSRLIPPDDLAAVGIPDLIVNSL